jgi:hypothetical protein
MTVKRNANGLTEKEHQERHKFLHKCLDELVADYISNTLNSLTQSSIMDLMEWSARQTQIPDDPENAPTLAQKLGIKIPYDGNREPS